MTIAPQQARREPLMDPLAAMRCWAYETTFDQVRDEHGVPVVFRIEPLPAADWLVATLQAGHLSYLPGLLDDRQRDRLMEALAVGDLTSDELVAANQDALEQMSGWSPWWRASKLIALLAGSYETIGTLIAEAGVDPQHHSLGAVLGAVYGMTWRNTGSKEDRAKLTQYVVTPPENVLSAGEWDEEAAEAAVWALIRSGPTGHRD